MHLQAVRFKFDGRETLSHSWRLKNHDSERGEARQKAAASLLRRIASPLDNGIASLRRLRAQAAGGIEMKGADQMGAELQGRTLHQIKGQLRDGENAEPT